jgi:pyridoxine kinase
MPILAVSSHVSVGHVGNAAAVPALERLGHTVWRVDTVAFSNHPGHGHHTGTVRPDHEVRDLLAGIGRHTGWRGCDGIYSGYLGEAGSGWALADAVDAAREVEPRLVYVCDPIIGDHGRVFVRDGVEKAIRERLVPRATAITPNAFELERLSGHRVETVEHAHAAAVTLLEWGPDIVIGTGIPDGDDLAIVIVTVDGSHTVRTRRRDRAFFGTGDLFAGLFLAHYLDGRDPNRAMARSVAGLDVATAATEAAGTVDLALIANLDAIVRAERPD